MRPSQGLTVPKSTICATVFATASVQDFHRSGADPQGKLPLLSAYLGHADPAYTYWYLQACPELLGLAAARLERWEEGRR